MSRKLHILSVTDDLGFGGDENRLLFFGRTIDRDRFRHTVLTIRGAEGASESSLAMRAQYAQGGIQVADLGEPGGKGATNGHHRIEAGASLVRKIRNLLQFIRRHHVDLLDAHIEPSNLLCVITSVLTDIPCAITIYSVQPLAPFPFWRSIQQFTLCGADAIITDSHARAQDIRSFAMRSNARIVVIPNGVSPPLPVCPPAAMKAKLGIPNTPDGQVVAQFSHFIPYKAHSLLLRAAKFVASKKPNTHFLLVGYEREKGYKEALLREACELGIQARTSIVSYPGPIGDIWGVVDIQAHPSLFDSLPNAIIEGMAVGKPLVATSVGGIPEIVEHERTGLLVRPNSPEALAKGLLDLLDHPEKAKRLATAAHQRYMQMYRPEIMTRRLEDLFESLMPASPRTHFSVASS